MQAGPTGAALWYGRGHRGPRGRPQRRRHRRRPVTHAKQCPWPHSINRLVGVKATCLEELPKSCTCGELLTYADDLIFLSEPKVSGLNPEVVEVTPLSPFQHRAGTP